MIVIVFVIMVIRIWKSKGSGAGRPVPFDFKMPFSVIMIVMIVLLLPVIQKMNERRLTFEDYRGLLYNLRQQVIDGSRWISRAASNVTRKHFEIRSAFIGHSSDEHRDFEMLESDYVSVGGDLETIQNGSKNIGSEALSEYIC